MKDVFINYVNDFDLDNEKIKLKYDHSLRVMNLCIKYAKLLNFSEKDIKLAGLIGLFHDIGRFKQIKECDTFSDLNSFDHAMLSSKILFEDGLIKEIWDDESDYELIKFAIENHNKISLEETNDERILKHAKLIRDADKVDIIYLTGNLGISDLTTVDIPFEEKALDEYYDHKLVSWEYENSKNYWILVYFSYVFDINYEFSLKEISKYYDDLYDKIKDNKVFEDVYNELKRYINERLSK